MMKSIRVKELTHDILKVADELDRIREFYLAAKLDSIAKKINDDNIDKEQESIDLLNTFNEGGDLSEYERLLVENGVTPFKNKGNSFLGEGSYGEVHSVVSDGKEFAAKVVDDSREADVLQKIEELKKTFPKEVTRHFPMIKEIIRNDTGDIIVMEKLYPLNDYVKEILFPKKDRAPDHGKQDVILKDPDSIYKILSDITDNFKIFNEDEKDFIVKEVFDLNGNTMQGDFKNQFAKKIKDAIDEAGKTLLERDFSKISNIFEMQNKVDKYLSYYMGDDAFPIDGIGNEVKEQAIGLYPEAKSLINALKVLRDKGILWGDVHQDNVMQRADGTPVLIDFGLYSM